MSLLQIRTKMCKTFEALISMSVSKSLICIHVTAMNLCSHSLKELEDWAYSAHVPFTPALSFTDPQSTPTPLMGCLPSSDFLGAFNHSSCEKQAKCFHFIIVEGSREQASPRKCRLFCLFLFVSKGRWFLCYATT